MIGPDNNFALLAMLLSLSALGACLESTRIGRRVSGVGLVVFGALAASQFNIMPRSAPLYGVVWSYLVPLAIALFLLKADLVKVFREGGRVLIAFGLGAIGAAGGALLGAALLDLGVSEPKVAAVFSATYIGGSLNFVAVAEAVHFDNETELAAALAIDNVLGVSFILMMNLVAGWSLLQRMYPWRADSIFGDEAVPVTDDPGSIELRGLLISLAIAASAVAISASVAAALGLSSYTLLFITALMTAVATFGRQYVSRLRGEDILAMMMMYMFFAIIGAGADISGLLTAAPEYFLMVLMIFAGNLLVTFIVGRWLKLNYAELIVASLACIAGPPVAAAIAILMKWRNLVVPGILTGILGYVVGNFIGVWIFWMLGGAHDPAIVLPNLGR